MSGADGEASAPPTPPSRAKLAIASVAALAVAGIVLVTVVLPAEYDIDPLGTGRALGLVVLSGSGSGSGDIPVRSDGLTSQSASYRVDERSFALGPGEFVEYKYRLEQGETMVYTWEASNWVRSEMHAEADDQPEGTAEFFQVVEEGLHRHGTYTAPFPGIHGWYWLNEGSDSVTVTIHAAGFFTQSIEYREETPPVAREIEATPTSDSDATPAPDTAAPPPQDGSSPPPS